MRYTAYAMLYYYQKHTAHEALRKVDTHPVRDVWVSGTEVRNGDIDEVVDRFKLDKNTVRDVLDQDELPRIEYEPNTLYVFVRTPHRNGHGEVVTSPMLLVVQESAFITLSNDGFVAPEKIVEPSRIEDIPTLLIATIAAVVGDYEELIHKTGKYITDTNRRLQTHDVNNKDFIRFVTIENNLNTHHTNLSGILAVLQRLKENRYDLFNAGDHELIEDISLHINQLLVAVASHNQAVTSIRSAHSTIANNTLNQRMKTLTVLTVLIALPNVFYGMYGMNVTLPFAEEPWAYGAVVLFTIMLILFVYLLAKRFRIF